jgi:hypothetical protein
LSPYSHSDLLHFVFGHDLGDFLSRCDRRHPDLSSGEASDFLKSTDEIVRVARFCSVESLSTPLGLMAANCPKSFGRLPSMVRALRDAHRDEARSKKSVTRIRLSSICDELKKVGADLPKSFLCFKDGESISKEPLRDWMAIAARFESIGCHSLANAAKVVSSELRPDGTGFNKMTIRRAALILCKSLGISSESQRGLFVGPALASNLPSSARESVMRSERSLAGFPVFDHHVVVFLSDEGSPLRPADRDFVILGERDGECYFLCSD